MAIFPIEQIPSITAGKQLWLDASDATTIVASGSAISSWKDKSGLFRNAGQATGASQPTYTLLGRANRNVITFDGSADYMTVTHNTQLNPNTGGYTVFMVSHLTDAASSGFVIVKGNTNTTTLGWSIVISSQGPRGRDSAANNFILNNVYVSPSATYIIMTVTFSGSGIEAFLNNASVGTASYVASINSTSNLAISGGPTGSSPISQAITEIFFSNVQLTSAQITKVNRYLANKWGISL